MRPGVVTSARLLQRNINISLGRRDGEVFQFGRLPLVYQPAPRRRLVELFSPEGCSLRCSPLHQRYFVTDSNDGDASGKSVETEAPDDNVEREGNKDSSVELYSEIGSGSTGADEVGRRLNALERQVVELQLDVQASSRAMKEFVIEKVLDLEDELRELAFRHQASIMHQTAESPTAHSDGKQVPPAQSTVGHYSAEDFEERADARPHGDEYDTIDVGVITVDNRVHRKHRVHRPKSHQRPVSNRSAAAEGDPKLDQH